MIKYILCVVAVALIGCAHAPPIKNCSLEIEDAKRVDQAWLKIKHALVDDFCQAVLDDTLQDYSRMVDELIECREATP